MIGDQIRPVFPAPSRPARPPLLTVKQQTEFVARSLVAVSSQITRPVEMAQVQISGLIRWGQRR